MRCLKARYLEKIKYDVYLASYVATLFLDKNLSRQYSAIFYLLDTINSIFPAKKHILMKTRKTKILVREKAFNLIRKKIVSGNYDPGTRLTEEGLSKDLGVSRTPVREALHKLELEGLVRPMGAKGFCVSLDSAHEIEEVFEIRLVLEGYALRIACENMTEDVLKELAGFVEKAEIALSKNDQEELYDSNARFHERLNDFISFNQRFHSLLNNLREYVIRYYPDTLQQPDAAKRTAEGHCRILNALKLGDPDFCEKIMRQHMVESKEDVLVLLHEKIPARSESKPPKLRNSRCQ